MAGGEVQAEKKLRILLGSNSGNAPATWRGSGSSPSDNKDDGMVDDDDGAIRRK